MIRNRILGVLFAFLLGATAFGEQENDKFRGWTHLELGAGNYGEDGHTQRSLKMTVLMKLTQVSSKPNYVDQLPEVEDVEYSPQHQYAVLFSTLDELVAKFGDQGMFHVNDLFKEYSDFAAKKLTEYAKKQNYDQVVVTSIPGDYERIDAKQTLKTYQRSRYDSVHLKNPEVSFFHYGMDGDKMITSAKHRKKARETLQKLANLGKDGMYFFPVDVQDYFIPTEEKDEFIDKHKFYLPTDEWEPVAYYFPEGKVIPSAFGRVFFIKAEDRIVKEEL